MASVVTSHLTPESRRDHDIVIVQGEDYSETFQFLNDGAVVDMTGWTIMSKIARNPGDSAIVSFSVDNVVGDRAQGKFTMSLTNVQTAALTFAEARYDVKMVDGDSVVRYWLAGKVWLVTPITT